MTVFQGAVEATFAAFGVDAVYTPVGGEPTSVRGIAKRADTIVGFGQTPNAVRVREPSRFRAFEGSRRVLAISPPRAYWGGRGMADE